MNDSIGPVGFIGLGIMGEPMCANMIRGAGLRVLACDLDPAPVARLHSLGAESCASLAEMVALANTVCLSLPGIDQVEAVCLGAGGIATGSRVPRRIVDMSTSDPARTRVLAAELARRGITFIDAPVARAPEAARDGTLLIMVGAEPADFELVAPLLRTMGTDVIRCGAVGAGQIVKVMNNMVLMTTVHALAEALLVGERSGVDGAQLFDVLSKGTASSEALRIPGLRALVPRDFSAKRFSAQYALKDVTLAANLAARAGVESPCIDRTRELLQRTVDQGSGELYYPVLIEHIRRS